MTDPDWEKALAEHYGDGDRDGYDTPGVPPRTRSTRVSFDTSRDLSRVERFELIDHRMETIAAEQPVRAVIATGAKVTLSFQDSGKTLKVFLSDE